MRNTACKRGPSCRLDGKGAYADSSLGDAEDCAYAEGILMVVEDTLQVPVDVLGAHVTETKRDDEMTDGRLPPEAASNSPKSRS